MIEIETFLFLGFAFQSAILFLLFAKALRCTIG